MEGYKAGPRAVNPWTSPSNPSETSPGLTSLAVVKPVVQMAPTFVEPCVTSSAVRAPAKPKISTTATQRFATAAWVQLTAGGVALRVRVVVRQILAFPLRQQMNQVSTTSNP